jgi:hypothetical protein
MPCGAVVGEAGRSGAVINAVQFATGIGLEAMTEIVDIDRLDDGKDVEKRRLQLGRRATRIGSEARALARRR